MSIDRAGKYRSWYGGDGGRLRWTAPLSLAASRRRRIPNTFTLLQTKSKHSAPLFGVSIGINAIRHQGSGDIGQCYVDIGLISGGAPFYAT